MTQHTNRNSAYILEAVGEKDERPKTKPTIIVKRQTILSRLARAKTPRLTLAAQDYERPMMVFIWSYMTSTMAEPTVRSTLALAPLKSAALPAQDQKGVGG